MKKHVNEIILAFCGVCIILLVISIIITANANTKLSAEIEQLNSDINVLESRVNSNHSQYVSEINSLKSQLEESMRYYYGNSYTIENYVPATDIVTISYYFNLKEYSSNDKVYIKFTKDNASETKEATGNGGLYVVQFDIESKSSYDVNLIIDGERIRTQHFERINVYKSRFSSVNPSVGIIMYNNKYYADLGLYISNDYSKDDRYKFVSGDITLTYDGKTIYNEPNISTFITEENQKQILSTKKSIYFAEHNDESYTDDVFESLNLKITLIDGFGFTYTYDHDYNK